MSRHPKAYLVHGDWYHEFWQVRVVYMITDIWYISFLKHHLYDFTILSIWFLTDIISHFDAWLHICLRCSRCCRWNDVSTAKAWNAPSSIFRPLRCDERWKVGETCIVLRDRFLGYKQITYIKYISGWWFQNVFYFHPYLGQWSNLTNIFQMGRNHQPDICIQICTSYTL